MRGPSQFCDTTAQDTYQLLFDLEIYLRTLARWELRGQFGREWKGRVPAEIAEESGKRLRQEREIRYLDELKSGFLSYLTLPELKEIIVGPLWQPCIKMSWPPLELVQSEFKKLISVRNKVAHFRRITVRDQRVAYRFAEDLADWSRVYRHERHARVRVPQTCSEEDDTALRRFSPALGEVWRNLTLSRAGERWGLDLEIGGHHLALIASVVAGSVDPTLMLPLLDRHERDITFCRLGRLGDAVCIYVPRSVDQPTLTALSNDFLRAIDNPILGLSSEDARAAYEFAEREVIVPWELELPLEFKL